MSADPEAIRTRALPPDRPVLRQYLHFLLSENHLDAAEPIALQLAAIADDEDTPTILNFIDRRLSGADPPVRSRPPGRLLAPWNSLCTRNQIPFTPLSTNRAALTNADFR